MNMLCCVKNYAKVGKDTKRLARYRYICQIPNAVKCKCLSDIWLVQLLYHKILLSFIIEICLNILA